MLQMSNVLLGIRDFLHGINLVKYVNYMPAPGTTSLVSYNPKLI